MRPAVGLLILGLGAFGANGTSSNEVKAESDVQETIKGASPKPVYVDVTQSAGLAWVIDRFADGAMNLVETMGGGGGFVDYDQDGRMDVYFVSYTLTPQADGRVPTDGLFRNNGDGSFTDVTARAGLARPMRGMGLAVGDYDNDGWPDLYVSGFREQRLYRNGRDGTFADVTAPAGLADRSGSLRWGTSAAFFDPDGDGDLDLFVGQYLQVDPDKALPCQMVSGRPFCDISRFRGSPSVLYRNEGDGRFRDVSAAAGIGRIEGKALGALAADLDRDGRSDLFVANDTSPNFLFKNRGDGTFTEAGLEADVAFDQAGRARGAMGVDAHDHDGDGRLDLFVTNFTHQGSSFFVAEEGGRYRDAAREAGLSEASLAMSGFGVRFLDEDNDGLADLVVVNGHPFEPVAAVWPGITYAEPVFLYENTGRGFREAARERGTDLARPMVGRGLATGDFDDDGDPDLLLLGVGERPRLLRNDGGNRRRWLGVRLIGARSNRDGVGARVTVTVGGRSATKVRAGGTSYASNSDPRLLFGLGDDMAPARVEVSWPSGHVDVVNAVEGSRYITVREGVGMAAPSTGDPR
jgi:enediyne biosynthesis protein E4